MQWYKWTSLPFASNRPLSLIAPQPRRREKRIVVWWRAMGAFERACALLVGAQARKNPSRWPTGRNLSAAKEAARIKQG
jgi:hypothetical protein